MSHDPLVLFLHSLRFTTLPCVDRPGGNYRGCLAYCILRLNPPRRNEGWVPQRERGGRRAGRAQARPASHMGERGGLPVVRKDRIGGCGLTVLGRRAPQEDSINGRDAFS
jgi:hypothetical protein